MSDEEDDFRSPMEELAKRKLSYKDYDPVTFDVLKVNPEDFASQITLKDLPVFKAITPEELSDCGWTEKQKRYLAPNVMAFTDRFNDVCLWTQREILSSERCSRRSQSISHFIKIAKRLLDLNNVHSAFAIVSALQCQSIYRLEKTWHGVSRSDKASFNRLKRLFDSDSNWERLRDYVDSQKLPCIPYLGLYLTDLNFLHVTQKKKENFFAARPQEYMKNNIIRLLAHFQDSRYDNLTSIPCLQKYLESTTIQAELIRVLEDDLYKQSLLREPDAPSGNFSRRSSLSRLSGLMILRSTRSPTPQAEEKDPKTNKSKSLTPQLPLSSSKRSHRKTQSVGGAGYFAARGIENSAFVPSGLPPLPTPTSSEAPDAPDASMVSSVFEPDSLADDLTRSLNLSAEPGDDDFDGFCYSPKAVTAENENERPLICDDALDPENAPVIEGVVERSILRAHGSKPVKVRISHEYYLELRESNLFQFEKKKLSLTSRRTERDHFRRRKGKVMSMRGECGWKVMSASDEKPGFELHHPSTGRIYRYRCKSNAVAAEWRRKLLESMHNGSPRNLISLD